ncbi:hypothetical protein [Bacillus sp. MRMR6]|nr:hypothetical protein [Bacillus sp. MRMR6]
MEEKLNSVLLELGNLNKGQKELITRSDKMENGQKQFLNRTDHLEKG